LKETLRHREALEYYYSLGQKRSLTLVAHKFNVSKQSVTKWNKNFNWQKRVELRDIENAKLLEKKTNKAVVNTKADYRTEIKAQLGILKALLNKVIKDIKNESAFDIGSVNELKDIINSYEKLSKLDLLMMGEATERGELNITNAKQKFIDRINNIAKRAREGKPAK